MIVKHQHFDIEQKVILERFVFKPPLRTPYKMENEACFFYVLNGNGKLYASHAKALLEDKQAFLIKCSNYIGNWEVENKTEETYQGLAIHFYPEVLKLAFKDEIPQFLDKNTDEDRIAVQKVKVDEMIESYIKSLLFYFENPSLVNDELLVLKIKELILLLANTDSSGGIREILQSLFVPEEYNFKKIIQQYIFEELSMEELAFLTNLSLSSFKRRFKEVFQDTPAHYIKTRRLEKASKLLKINKLSITEVAYECAFSDIGGFSKSFKNHFGLTPSEYRQKYLLENI